MKPQQPFTVVAAVNNREVLTQNLLRSPELAGTSVHQLVLKEGFNSAALAYNSGIDESLHDLMIFVHQDVYLPPSWFQEVRAAIGRLDVAGVRWGVLGCNGVSRNAEWLGRVFSTGWGMVGKPVNQPEQVETLDEIVLILRRSSGLRFDPKLPNFHMYGADVCLTAAEQGFSNFVLPAFCVHNTHQLLSLPPDFYESYWHVKAKWRKCLPIQTSCIRISRFDLELRKKKLEDLVDRLRGRKRAPAGRLESPIVEMNDEIKSA